MTPSVMLYSLLVAALVGAAALISERVVAELKLARRFVWLAALVLSLALPTYAVLRGSSLAVSMIEASPQTAIGSQSFTPPTLARSSGGSAIEIDRPRFAWPDWAELGPFVTVTWIASSIAICAFYLLSWLSLRRELGRVEQRHVDGVEVRILDEYGPAIFGFFRPQIIVPRWLLDANVGLRQIVLRHEREHIAARDPLTLLAGLVLVAAAPWNLPLWWQLRRLRLASEIDCDARVLRSGTADTAYAEALLEVQQRRTRMPIAVVALIEPVSQLERRIRIMMSRQSPSRRTVVGACTLTAAALVIAACAVNRPDAGTLIRPLGSTASLGPLQGVGRIVSERHGTEIRSSDRRAALVDLFFDESGALLRSTYEGTDESIQLPEPPGPASEPRPSTSLIVCLGILEGKACELDAATNRYPHMVRVRTYGFLYSASDGSDSEDIDRRIAERYFGHIFSAPPPENSGYWVLLDNTGTPVAAGEEALRTPFSEEPAWAQLDAALKQRYPQVEIQDAVWAPIKNRQSRVVTDRAGANVQLYTAWLSEDSPLPVATR